MPYIDLQIVNCQYHHLHVIDNNKPVFIGVSEILQKSTNHTVDLLTQELEVTLKELKDKWHFSSLERIFIENRIYHAIEEFESWEEIISTIHHEINLLLKI